MDCVWHRRCGGDYRNVDGRDRATQKGAPGGGPAGDDVLLPVSLLAGHLRFYDARCVCGRAGVQPRTLHEPADYFLLRFELRESVR